MSFGSTIFALASAPGRAGVAVFRISGPEAQKVFSLLGRDYSAPHPREATLRKLHHPQTGEVIDHALLLWFPGPDSFTGEDVVELHTHGGRAITTALTDILRTLPGFRMAEPGEFARRAFENGKLDLTEAEAIADLVDAETEAQRRQAMRQYEGALGALYEGWCERLKQSLAYLEAAIDFADEDLPQDLADRQTAALRELINEIVAHLNDQHRGERLREGFSIAILGPPNAGKSSLLNVLAQRDAAIVSATAGTTRDVIEVHLDLGGYPVTLADTAGLRETAGEIESEGIRRALARAEKADLKLLVFDGAHWPCRDEATQRLADDRAIQVVNKADVISSRDAGYLFLSAKTGEGIPALLEKMMHEIDLRFAATGAPPLTRPRHRAALEESVGHLRRSFAAAEAELRAEDTRLALRALGRITGHVGVEDLLDVIFRDFCIGK
ncbi:MAG: tRNA uridine-5-carboxymethylaminomethyl(34) synthesis GTPase MnmE [Alphaproteobacteria bacterium]|nr:tRNA uridine-5-carboxymethylaminomethyl(34) synthesis GTPase MnmE [Alphaproteobacteria bacterium]